MDAQETLLVGASATHDAISDGQLDDANDAHPSGKETSPSSQSCSLLETLPPELRYKIMSFLPDLQTLRSLVHASPILHAQYRHSRDTILHASLSRELDGFAMDAYAAGLSRPNELGSPRTHERVNTYLDMYGHWLASKSDSGLDLFDPGMLRSISAFHLSVAQPLAHRYCEWALANLKQAISSSRQEEMLMHETEPDDLDLATSEEIRVARCEEIRVFRAIYRYEIYLNLFGRNEGKREHGFCRATINYSYFDHLRPWEIEAIQCIDVFIRETYQGMLGRVKDDLCPRNVKFRLEGGVYRYEEAFRLTAEIGDYVESMVSRGLGMAIRLLSIDDDEQLAMEFRQSLFREKCPDASLKEAVSMDAQRISRYDMPRILPGRVEVMGGEYMGFMGDSVLPTEPPQAWVQLWGEMYSTIYGEYIPESVQRWGYVMWNKDRWNVPGGDKLVVKQWRQYPHCIYEVMEDYGWTPGI